MSGKIKPAAWMHVMDNTEGIKGNKPWVVFTASKKNPFGTPGIDYSNSYPVTSTPLYAIGVPEPLAPPRLEGREYVNGWNDCVIAMTPKRGNK